MKGYLVEIRGVEGYGKLDTGYKIQDARYWILNAECQMMIQDAGYKIVKAG